MYSALGSFSMASSGHHFKGLQCPCVCSGISSGFGWKWAGGSPGSLAYVKETFLNTCIKVLCLHIVGVPVANCEGEQTLVLLEETLRFHVSFTMLVKATSERNFLKKFLFFKDMVQFIFKMYFISKRKALWGLQNIKLHWLVSEVLYLLFCYFLHPWLGLFYPGLDGTDDLVRRYSAVVYVLFLLLMGWQGCVFPNTHSCRGNTPRSVPDRYPAGTKAITFPRFTAVSIWVYLCPRTLHRALLGKRKKRKGGRGKVGGTATANGGVRI